MPDFAQNNQNLLFTRSQAFPWRIELSTRRIFLDEQFAKLFTIKDINAIRQLEDFYQLLSSDDTKALEHQLNRLQSNKTENIALSVRIHTHNAIINVQFNGAVNLNDSQIIEGAGMVIDHQAKKHDIDRYHTELFRQYEDGILIVKENGDITDANPAMENLSGFSSEDIISQNLVSFLHKLHISPHTCNAIHSFLKQINTEKQPKHNKLQRKPCTIRPKAGESSEFALSCRACSSQENVCLAVFFKDINEQQKIEKRANLHSSILQKAPVTIIFTDTEGKIEYVNPAFTEFTGYDFESVKGIKTSILRSGYHDLEFYKNLWGTIKNGNTWEGNILNKKRSGEKYWEKAMIAPHFNNKGDITGFIKAAEDITEQINTRRELKKSEIKYRDVFETAGVGIIYTDKEGTILDTNRKFDELIGKASEQLHQKSAMELINKNLPRSTAKKLLPVLFHILKGNRIDPLEIDVDNRSYEIQSDYNPELESNIGILRDITDKKNAEKALQQSEAKYRYLVEHMNDGLAITDCNEKLTFVNLAVEQIFKMSSSELLGSTLKNLATKSSAETIEQEEQQRLMGIRSTYYIEVLTPDKYKKNLEITASPIFRDNVYNGSFGIIRDITEKVRAETELKRAYSQMKSINKKLQEHATELEMAKKKAEESDRLKSAFLANISHEIRTPMNGIVGFAQLCMNTGLTEAKRKNYLQIISESTMQLESVVMDIIDLSKIESGESIFNKGTVSPQEIIREVFEKNVKAANAKQLNINMKFINNPPKINTDKVRLRQVIDILLENAIKFTPEGYIQINVHTHKTLMTIEVTDTGIGIAEANQEIIFEPFRQVETAMKRRFGGTGLGLTIARKIAYMLGGDITVDSIPGKGSTFMFTHPLS